MCTLRGEAFAGVADEREGKDQAAEVGNESLEEGTE
jgi:hypothetical protein